MLEIRGVSEKESGTAHDVLVSLQVKLEGSTLGSHSSAPF